MEEKLLKAMYLVKNYCSEQTNCKNCILAMKFPNVQNYYECPFAEEPGVDWDLQDINSEKINSVFK